MANTPGDYLIRRNSSDSTSVIDDAGEADLIAAWDTQVAVEGTSITYSAPTFTLASGKYLICWSEWFAVAGGRQEAQSRLVIGGTRSPIGSGQQFFEDPITDVALGGMAILDIASDSTSLTTSFYRTDNNTITTQATRVPDKGGSVAIVALDSTWSYGRYSTASDADAPTSSGFSTIAFDTNDEQDTGFSNSSGAITLTDAGRYIVCVSLPFRMDDVNVTCDFMLRITLDDSEVMGTRRTTFINGKSSCFDNCLSYGGVIDVAASDVLKVEVFRDLGTSGGDTLAGANVQILKLPSGNETVIVNATSGNMNTSAETLFAWDTVPHIDTGAFTHTEGDSVIEVDNDGLHLFFCTMCQIGDGGEEDAPTSKFGLNASTTDSLASGSSQTKANGGEDCGHSFGAMYSMSAEDTIGVYVQSEGFTTDTLTVDYGAFSAVRISSLFPAPAGTRRVFVT